MLELVARREFRERYALSSVASVLFEMGQNILVTVTPSKGATHCKLSITEPRLHVHLESYQPGDYLKL